MSPEILTFFSKYIEKETGVVFHDTNLYQLKTRLEEIVQLEKISGPQELVEKFNSFLIDPGLKQRLLDHATNNETLFFRDPSFFTAIESFILREILLEAPAEIKIWSAAASSGQEAVSVAIAMDELSKKVPLPPVSILATDISDRVIKKARKGIYSDFEVMRGLSDERKHKYFTQTDGGWQVKSPIHSKIRYEMNNLIKPSVHESFHIILCRNVLIYQGLEVKKSVIDHLFKCLLPSGGILLGVGETMLGIKGNVETTMVGNVIFYRSIKGQFTSVA